MYKKSYNSNEVAIWGELVRRYISFHKGKDMEQITQWGLSNWGEVSPLIKKGYVQTKYKKEDKVVWYKPNKEIIELIIRPSVEIATKALGDTTELDFGSCDAYVLEVLNSIVK